MAVIGNSVPPGIDSRTSVSLEMVYAEVNAHFFIDRDGRLCGGRIVAVGFVQRNGRLSLKG